MVNVIRFHANLLSFARSLLTIMVDKDIFLTESSLFSAVGKEIYASFAIVDCSSPDACGAQAQKPFRQIQLNHQDLLRSTSLHNINLSYMSIEKYCFHFLPLRSSTVG